MPPDTALQDRFTRALELVEADLMQDPGVVGILFFGSAALGPVRAQSDLDLFVVTADDTSGHQGRLVLGVPVEISFGSRAQWLSRVEAEVAVIVHAWAHGCLLYDARGDLVDLARAARTLWRRGPAPITPSALLRLRFQLTGLLQDLADDEPGGAQSLLAAAALQRAVDGYLELTGRWPESPRRAIAALGRHNPVFGAQVDRCAGSGFPVDQVVAVVRSVLDRAGGAVGEYSTRRATPAL